jgi:hypothetical protein
MDSKPPAAPQSCRQAGLLRQLYREAARRWIILGIAMGFLVWLGIFAGRVRDPQAVKRAWAVMVSRVLAVAGGVLVARLLMVSDDERVPVLLFDLRSAEDPGRVMQVMRDTVHRFKARGYEVVPLGDVVEFVRDRRYVPKKCIGLVVEAAVMPQLAEAGEALRGIEFTGLLPPAALEGCPGAPDRTGIPAGATLGLSLVGETNPGDSAGLLGVLERQRARSVEVTGCEPRYVRIEPSGDAGLRGLLKATSYTCFLNGGGFNRFGDQADMLRLLDTTAMTDSARAGSALSVYVGLFRGRYYLWPVAAFLRLAGAGPEGV